MAPSPRNDSLRQLGEVDLDKGVPAFHRNSGETVGTVEEEEQGALSLAEKLEIIRYNPLTRTFSTPNTSVVNSQSLIANSVDGSTSTLHEVNRPRPWKPGQLLGLNAPPRDNGLDGTPLDDDNLAILQLTPPSARANGSIETGSGYMSFASDYEGRGRDWKSLLRNVHVPTMLRRSSGLKYERRER